MHYCGCKGTARLCRLASPRTKLQLLQRVFQRMLTNTWYNKNKTAVAAYSYNCCFCFVITTNVERFQETSRLRIPAYSPTRSLSR